MSGGSNRPLVSVSVPVATNGDLAALSDRAQRAEELGVDALFVTDHPAPTNAWLKGSGHPTLDPFVALSFIAAATTTLRVHTNLLVLPYRHPLATAKAVASLDVLSGGRTILGVGVGSPGCIRWPTRPAGASGSTWPSSPRPSPASIAARSRPRRSSTRSANCSPSAPPRSCSRCPTTVGTSELRGWPLRF